MQFIDEATIVVKAGDGGRGIASFRREKSIPEGGPDGGDGGRGGSIIAVADQNLNTLLAYRYMRQHIAKNGAPGRGADRYGRGAKDVILPVPVGTVITDEHSGAIVADLSQHEQRVVLAQGGHGGLGNLHFKSSTNRTPRQCTPGGEGEEKRLRFELQVLADVGLLGFPNAGKSTLIRAVSNAHPKVADYPFTTLHPHLGMVRVGEAMEFVIADLPGLIPGAAAGAGLGTRFLKHLSRTRLLLHVVDLCPLPGEPDPVTAIRSILAELKLYDPSLSERPRWLVFSKADLIPDPVVRKEQIADILRRLRWTKRKGPVFTVAAIQKMGCPELCYAIGDHLREADAKERADTELMVA